MELVTTYYGVNIYRGGALRYWAMGPTGRLMADTLATMKEAIRAVCKKN